MTYPDPDTKLFIKQHETDDIRQLALQARSHLSINMPLAIQQIAGRQIAKIKIPSWYLLNDILYPQHLSMEQCSSEKTALYKTNLCIGNTFMDLTGGFGVDFSFMSQGMDGATYIEKQKELVDLARHNFEVLNLKNTRVIEGNGESYLESMEQNVDTLYIDPARRSDAGHKVVFIEDCTPNVVEIDRLLNKKAKRVIIKLSPMLDITHAVNSLSNISEVHIISVSNECKELLLIKENHEKETQIHCINILNNGEAESFVFSNNREKTSSIKYTDTTGKYLYEPNSSILKAGAYKSIAETFHLDKLHINSHLYTSDKYINDFPGRKFIVKKLISPNKKEIKAQLKDIAQANISTRNYPFSVAELRKQTKLKEGGDEYIFGTTLSNEKKVLILCEKVDK